ncbi:hypothetical protein ACFVP3_23275 [Streptomyces sp. NPDC057806]|uniref:hypothetical protein n=1 Tax=Streptomyces sp. NPDC057806 TaxID=3346255 RepID=UPI0036BC7219
MHPSVAHVPRNGGTTTNSQWASYPQPTFVPPLHIAREQARRSLDTANALDLDTATVGEVYGSHGALQESLRQVLAALDAEDGRHA